jgi:hypothetical protein
MTDPGVEDPILTRDMLADAAKAYLGSADARDPLDLDQQWRKAGKGFEEWRCESVYFSMRPLVDRQLDHHCGTVISSRMWPSGSLKYTPRPPFQSLSLPSSVLKGELP